MSDARQGTPPQRSWWPLVAVCVAVFMMLIDITVVNVALPDIEHELACGFAQTPVQLSAFRAAQGVGGAMMFATSLALIAASYQGRDRGTAFGVWGATAGASVAVGPLVGGALVSGLSWRWIFFVNLPIAVVAVYITLRRLGESRDVNARGVDWWGFVTFSGALALLVYALIRGNDVGWTSASTLTELIGSGVLLVAFVVVEARSREPMFDLGLFRNSAFVGAQAVAFCLSAAAFALFLYLTLYLQNVLHYSAFETGLRMLPITAMSLVVAPVAGKLTERVPFRILLGLSLGVLAVGLALMTGLDAGSSWTALLAGFVVMGVGIGATNAPLGSLAVGVVEPRRAGMASGINSTFRQVGIATGTAAFGAIFQSRVTSVLAGHLAGTSAPPGTADRLGKAVSSGAIDAAARGVPGQVRTAFVTGARDAFTSSFDRLSWIAAGVAAVGAVLAAMLIKQRDMVSSGTQVARPAPDAGGGHEPAAARRTAPSSSSMER
jgi:EmrB/QacA subfamily drug resistance transporter